MAKRNLKRLKSLEGPYIFTGRLNILKLAIVAKAIYGLSAIFIKISAFFFLFWQKLNNSF